MLLSDNDSIDVDERLYWIRPFYYAIEVVLMIDTIYRVCDINIYGTSLSANASDRFWSASAPYF